MYMCLCTQGLLNHKLISSQTLKTVLQKQNKSENAAINNTIKICAQNNHLSRRLDLFCLNDVLYLDRDHSQRMIL